MGRCASMNTLRGEASDGAAMVLGVRQRVLYRHPGYGPVSRGIPIFPLAMRGVVVALLCMILALLSVCFFFLMLVAVLIGLRLSDRIHELESELQERSETLAPPAWVNNYGRVGKPQPPNLWRVK